MSRTIIYYYTDWCPYCKKFNPVWEEIKEMVKELNDLGENIIYKEYDMDNSKDKLNNEFGEVIGYPTIRFKVGNNIRNYDGPRESEKLLFDLLEMGN